MARKVFSIDFEKCLGDEKCVIACSMFKENIFDLTKGRIQIVKKEDKALGIPVICEQCEDPPCMAVCPTKAISKDVQTRVVKINPNKCIGCKECMWACPFGAITLDFDKGVAIKCDHCDGDPVCVKFCTPGAIQYVRADRPATLEKKRDSAEKRIKAIASISGGF